MTTNNALSNWRELISPLTKEATINKLIMKLVQILKSHTKCIHTEIPRGLSCKVCHEYVHSLKTSRHLQFMKSTCHC